MYYEEQINEIKKAYNFLETQFNDSYVGFNWRMIDKESFDYDDVYMDSLECSTVSELVEYLQTNFNGEESVMYTDGVPYIEKILTLNLTDKDYLDCIANSYDFMSEYNLSQSWVNNALQFDDQKLHIMAFDLTNRRFNILTSFKDEQLVEAEPITYFLLDKEAYRHRAANLYSFPDGKWVETETEKKIKDIKLEAFEQLKVV